MDADQVGRLRDILEAARLICAYVAGVDETAFRRDTQRQDAVIRRVEIIGEATLHLSDQTRLAIPQLPYRRLCARGWSPGPPGRSKTPTSSWRPLLVGSGL